MNKKQKKTLLAIFKKPTQSNIDWKDVGALLKALGAEIKERKGSRVFILLNNERAVFHRPHPGKEANKGTVNSLRRFLENTGVKP